VKYKAFLWASLLLSFSWAHFDTLPNGKVNAWDKLVLEVSYDEKKGLISARAHSHHPDTALLIFTLQNVYEKGTLFTHEVRVNNHFASCNFGPFNDQERTPAPGYYKVAVWYMHDRQTPLMQKELNQTEFYNCVPPCNIDYQHYQNDVIQIGTDEAILEYFEETLKTYKGWIDELEKTEKDMYQFLLKSTRNLSRGSNYEQIKAEFEKEEEEGLNKLNEIHQKIQNLRQSTSLLYYEETLNEIPSIINGIQSNIKLVKVLLQKASTNERELQRVKKNLENLRSKELRKKFNDNVQKPESESEGEETED
jgi:prefoldin subunit 5